MPTTSGLTSASSLLGTSTTTLGDRHGRELFSNRRVNTNKIHEILVGRMSLHGETVALTNETEGDSTCLSDLTSIRRKNMETNNFSSISVRNELGKAALLHTSRRHLPLQRSE